MHKKQKIEILKRSLDNVNLSIDAAIESAKLLQTEQFSIRGYRYMNDSITDLTHLKHKVLSTTESIQNLLDRIVKNND